MPTFPDYHQEKIEAKALFGGEEGEKLKQAIEKTRTFEPGRIIEGLTTEQKLKIKVSSENFFD